MMNIEQKAKKSALTQGELAKILAGKRLDADTLAVAYDKALHSSKSYYDLSNISDPSEHQKAIEAGSGDNALIYVKMRGAYDAKMALVRAKDEPIEEPAEEVTPKDEPDMK